MSVAVRRAEYPDGAALYRAWQLLRQHNSEVDARIVSTPVSESEFLAGWGERLARETSAVYVADDGGKIVGFISGGIVPNQPDRLPELVGNVGYLFVEPAHRRHGIATRLFEAMSAWVAKQEGVSHIEMAVLEADAPAREFWARVGFSRFIERLWAPLPGADRE